MEACNYIVATFNVDYDDITDITNGYVQNCICDLLPGPSPSSCDTDADCPTTVQDKSAGKRNYCKIDHNPSVCHLSSPANCFDQPCDDSSYKYQDDAIPIISGPTLWKSWEFSIKSNASDQFCPDNELNGLCVEENCKGVISKNDGNELYTKFGKDAISCATQAEPFFRKPEGYTTPGSSLVLVNGQLEPTLTITADTWVRLRLGFMATGNLL